MKKRVDKPYTTLNALRASGQPIESFGLCRIQTVARMTGVPIAVLRAWEKRYGVPHPRRTDSAYRLYTDADVSLMKRLSALRASGLAASEAARLVLRGRCEADSQVHPPTVLGMRKVPWVVGGAGVESISHEVIARGGVVLPSTLEAHRVWLENVTGT